MSDSLATVVDALATVWPSPSVWDRSLVYHRNVPKQHSQLSSQRKQQHMTARLCSCQRRPSTTCPQPSLTKYPSILSASSASQRLAEAVAVGIASIAHDLVARWLRPARDAIPVEAGNLAEGSHHIDRVAGRNYELSARTLSLRLATFV